MLCLKSSNLMREMRLIQRQAEMLKVQANCILETIVEMSIQAEVDYMEEKMIGEYEREEREKDHEAIQEDC